MSREPRKPTTDTTKVVARLGRALQEQRSVRVRRRFADAEVISGFVSSLGSRWVAIAVLDDGRRPDGWKVIRLEDIWKVRIQEDPETVDVRVLRARDAWPLGPAPRLDLDHTPALLRDAGTAANLVAVQTETYRPDALWLGAVLEVTDDALLLDGVDAQAQWDDAYSFKLRDITQVSVGTSYAAALKLVAGPPPVRDLRAPLPVVKHRRGYLRH